jgi:hypothetical protein
MLDHIFVTYSGNEVSVAPVPALNLPCDPRYRPEMHHNPNFDMNCWALKPHTPDYRDGRRTSLGYWRKGE